MSADHPVVAAQRAAKIVPIEPENGLDAVSHTTTPAVASDGTLISDVSSDEGFDADDDEDRVEERCVCGKKRPSLSKKRARSNRVATSISMDKGWRTDTDKKNSNPHVSGDRLSHPLVAREGSTILCTTISGEASDPSEDSGTPLSKHKQVVAKHQGLKKFDYIRPYMKSSNGGMMIGRPPTFPTFAPADVGDWTKRRKINHIVHKPVKQEAWPDSRTFVSFSALDGVVAEKTRCAEEDVIEAAFTLSACLSGLAAEESSRTSLPQPLGQPMPLPASLLPR